MAQENNTAIIQGLYEAVNHKNYDYIANLGHASSEWRDVPFNFTATGEEAIIGPWKS